MRKDRNAFFSEANMSQASFMPAPNMPYPGPQAPIMNPAPYQAANVSQSYYAAPGQMGMPNTAPMTAPAYPMGGSAPNELESRLAKMERQIRRLETRVNKLESSSVSTAFSSTEDTDINISNSMYMI